MPFLLQALLVLAVLGFCFYLFRKHLAGMIGSPFVEIMYFIVVVAAILWLLNGFGIVHVGRWWHR